MCSSPGVIINRKHYGKLTDFLLRFTPLRLCDKKSLEILERLNFMATENCCGELVLCRLTGEDNLFYRVMFQCPPDPSMGCLGPSRTIIPPIPLNARVSLIFGDSPGCRSSCLVRLVASPRKPAASRARVRTGLSICVAISVLEGAGKLVKLGRQRRLREQQSSAPRLQTL